LKICNKTFSRI